MRVTVRDLRLLIREAGKRVTCPNCDGYGSLPAGDPNAEDYKEVTCKKCGGMGQVLVEAGRKKPKSKMAGRLGKCYVLAGRYVSSNSDATLVHGSIQGFGHPRIKHAWVVLANGNVHDAVWDKEMDRQTHDAVFNPIVDNEYDQEQVFHNTLKSGNWGPWSDDEGQVTEVLISEVKMQPVDANHLMKRVLSVLTTLLTTSEWFEYPVKRTGGTMGYKVTDDTVISRSDVRDGVLETLGGADVLRKGKDIVSLNVSKLDWAMGFRGSKIDGFHDELRSSLSSEAEKFGWYLLISDGRSWSFAPNYTTRVKDVPRYLWHLTPLKNVKRVLSRGLVPKAPRKVDGHSQRSYLPRVYLLADEGGIAELMMGFQAAEIGDAMAGGGRVDKGYAVFRIDTSKLSRHVKFFDDIEHANGVWTESAIPASAIELDTEKSGDLVTDDDDPSWPEGPDS